jgi:hypothetical protein
VTDSCEHDNEPSGSIKYWGNSRVAERLAASEHGPSCTELDTCYQLSAGKFSPPYSPTPSSLLTSEHVPDYLSKNMVTISTLNSECNISFEPGFAAIKLAAPISQPEMHVVSLSTSRVQLTSP